MKPAPIDFASYIGPGYFLRLAALDVAFRALHGSRFLEVGPGRGDLAAWLVSRGGRGTLADNSRSSVEYLRRRFDGVPGVAAVEHDIALIPPQEAGFDLAIALEVLEHVPDDLGLLKRMNSLVRPGGRLVVSVPAFMKRWGGLDECVGHLRRYERADIEKILVDAGFTDVELLCYGFPVCTIFSLMRKAYYVKALEKLRGESASARTSRSGVERPLDVRSRLVVKLLYALLFPMVLMQRMTLRHSMGEGWIALARKAGAINAQ
jgi:SAM-dependent methyltransferase